MELNWSTWLLEIINFLILVWILKHFLYQPVLDVIARRRAAIEKATADAATAREEAGALKLQFEARLGDWEKEKQQARAALEQELGELRRHRLEEIEAGLAAATERARVRDARQLAEARETVEREALELAARFATRLLGRLANPSLEAQLVGAGLDDLRALPAARREAIRDALQAVPEVQVASAFALPVALQEQLKQALSAVAARTIACRFTEDAALIAGLRIVAGPWILRINLEDELEGFASAGRDA